MELEEYQLIKRTETLYKYIRTLLIGTALMSVMNVTVLWQVESHLQLSLWLALMLTLVLVRSLSLVHYSKIKITKYNAQLWFDKIAISSFLAGISWGAGLLLFMSTSNPYHTGFIAFVYFGNVASNAFAMSLHYKVHLAFMVPYTACFIIKFLTIGFSTSIDNYITVLAAFAVLLFLFVLSSFARNAQASFNRSTQLAFENRELLNEVLEQKEAAENAVLAKNQFLAAASHDLRQPLHALGLYVSAFSSIELSDEARNIAHQMKKSTHSLVGLMDGLLDISRLDAASVEYRPQNISIEQTLSIIASEYEPVALKKGTIVDVNIERGLSVYTDELLFQRTMRNLVDNAVKFTNNGEINIVARRHDTNNEIVEVIIEDTGLGIPETEHKKIFTEFTQLDNQERDRQKGLGLGLAIVQRLCSLMSIKLTMKSELGKGTQFSLQVPAGSVVGLFNTTNTHSKHDSQVDSDNNFISLIGYTVLVVDDEIDILNAMHEVLIQWGADVIIADDIESAISNLHKDKLRPDLILADFRLRDNVDGVQVVNTIRDEFNDIIPALLISGDTSPDRLQLAKSSNIPMIHKPVETEQLSQMIAQLLTHSLL